MTLDTIARFCWDDIPREQVTEKLGRKIITGERIMIPQIWLAKGCVVPEHSHEAEQLSYIFEGALKFIINGEEQIVRAGELLHIPSWVKHEAVALEETHEMDVFSPIRYDWLNKTDDYFHNKPSAKVGSSESRSPATVYRWSEVKSEAMSPLIDRRYISGERATVALVNLQKGAVVPIHQHESEQLTWVRSGKLQLDLDGKSSVLAAGDVLRIPSQVPHMATALETTELLDAFSPRRDDWMTGNDQYMRSGAAASR
ncbi:MAG: cupin domain-containing protein [Gemmatimonadota bacterium]